MHTKLTRPVRLGIMLFLIAVFCIAAPAIILYTAGYRYDFKTQKIKQTGVISIDVLPRSAAVFLNDVRIQKSLPIRLPNRAPGAYRLRIEADGYKPWEKDITVESKQTTYIRDVTLFKNALPAAVLPADSSDADDAFFSADGAYVLFLAREQDIYEITLLDLREKRETPIMRARQESSPAIDWSPFSPTAAIRTEENGVANVRLLDARNPSAAAVFPVPVAGHIRMQWPRNPVAPSVFINENETVIELSENSRRSIGGASSSVWYVDEKRRLWQFDATAKTVSLGSENTIENLFSLQHDLEDILDVNDERLIGKSQERVLNIPLATRDERAPTTVSAGNARFNVATGEWLVWSPWELWTIYPDGNVELLNRTSDPVVSIVPLDEFGLLLLVTENKLLGFNPGYYVTHELFAGGNIEKIAADVAERKIYFWGTVGTNRGLFELEY
ncbi:MAG: hypothetical protein A3C90_03940 [Candidatus Magasanikbacteria bacterium RIFCSPHIGHO2_02_FULL_51_14]|uniref:PEGA domain-containing protein n=1 Tax=Candidatus Magasanikbacteria bacterium RIFCSPHIGHO2_02_FULL_51_14 TaxID=1798683 RepID=A0A1F6MDK9_9BACT|nr:MAG: hypothetical protein A3C90_03940 [Candidatus Magasanikbacteria bacterium RIFCSPHIGHO2_02_FULL_51_14]